MKQRENKLRRIFGLKIFLVANLIVLFFILFSFGREYVRNYEIEKEISGLGERASQLENENQGMVALLDKLKTNDFLEEEARIKLGLQKPGESVVVIRESGAASSVATNASSSTEMAKKKTSNATLWWDYFFNHQKL